MIRSFADKRTAAIFAGWYVSDDVTEARTKSKSPITIEELPTTDFSDIATGERMPPIPPGKILLEEFLKPMGLSISRFADAIKIPLARVEKIVNGREAITPDTALRLGRHFGISKEFWLNLQAYYEQDLAAWNQYKRNEK